MLFINRKEEKKKGRKEGGKEGKRQRERKEEGGEERMKERKIGGKKRNGNIFLGTSNFVQQIPLSHPPPHKSTNSDQGPGKK